MIEIGIAEFTINIGRAFFITIVAVIKPINRIYKILCGKAFIQQFGCGAPRAQEEGTPQGCRPVGVLLIQGSAYNPVASDAHQPKR